MTNYIYVDTIIRVFESDGNLHIVGGLANGETDLNGKDILEKSLHLIIPMKKAVRIFPEISDSLPKLLGNGDSENDISNQGALAENDEFEGQGLHFKI